MYGKLPHFILFTFVASLFSPISFAKPKALEACYKAVQSLVESGFGQSNFSTAKWSSKSVDCINAARSHPDDPQVLFAIGYLKLDRSKELASWREGLQALKLSAGKGFEPAAYLLFENLRIPYFRSRTVSFEGEGNVDEYFKQVIKSKNLRLQALLIYNVSSKNVPGYKKFAEKFASKNHQSDDDMVLLARAAMYERGYGVRANQTKRLDTLVNAAKAGNSTAKIKLAISQPYRWLGNLDETEKERVEQLFETNVLIANALNIHNVVDQWIYELTTKPVRTSSLDWEKTESRRQRFLLILSCQLEKNLKRKLQTTDLLPPCVM